MKSNNAYPYNIVGQLITSYQLYNLLDSMGSGNHNAEGSITILSIVGSPTNPYMTITEGEVITYDSYYIGIDKIEFTAPRDKLFIINGDTNNYYILAFTGNI